MPDKNKFLSCMTWYVSSCRAHLYAEITRTGQCFVHKSKNFALKEQNQYDLECSYHDNSRDIKKLVI